MAYAYFPKSATQKAYGHATVAPFPCSTIPQCFPATSARHSGHALLRSNHAPTHRSQNTWPQRSVTGDSNASQHTVHSFPTAASSAAELSLVPAPSPVTSRHVSSSASAADRETARRSEHARSLTARYAPAAKHAHKRRASADAKKTTPTTRDARVFAETFAPRMKYGNHVVTGIIVRKVSETCSTHAKRHDSARLRRRAARRARDDAFEVTPFVATNGVSFSRRVE